jgi:hypothetical protein
MMPGILYTHPLMLGGLAALAVPIIIHLLLRRKKKRLRFSTLQFLMKQDRQSSQRRKLRNWLLLAMRLLLVALLVTAFARPFVPQGGAGSSPRQKRQAIFVLDRSASMMVADTDGPRWSRAKELIQTTLAALDDNDRAALVGCTTHAEILSALVQPSVLAKTVAALTPAYGTSNLGEGLQQASKLAARANPDVATTVYVVSDLQRSACQNLGNYPFPQELDLRLLCTGDVNSPNLSLTELQLEPHEGAGPHLVAASFCDEENPDTKLELAIDGRVVFSSRLTLAPHASTNINFSLPALKPGWHNAQASLQTKDSFELDNNRYATFFVPEPQHALVVEPRKSGRTFEQESFFLAAALDPSQGSTNSVASDFSLVQVAPEDLTTSLSAQGAQNTYGVVLVPGLKELPHEAVRSLTEFVQAGGGLLLFLGDGVSANHYNNEFHNLLPAQLGTVEVAPDPAVGWRIGEFNTNAPAFAVFGLPESGDLTIPQFFKRYSLTSGTGATSVAFLEDGVPLVIVSRVGSGQVALVNSSADASWSDWPKHKTFVPWLHGLARQLDRRASQKQDRQVTSRLAGDDTEMDLGPGAGKAELTIDCPDKQTRSLATDDLGRIRNPGLTSPGIYSFHNRAGNEVHRVAVNLPSRESDLAAWKPGDFQQQLTRVQVPRETSPAAILFGSKTGQKEFWRLLLLAAVGFLLLETLLANRSSA